MPRPISKAPGPPQSKNKANLQKPILNKWTKYKYRTSSFHTVINRNPSATLVFWPLQVVAEFDFSEQVDGSSFGFDGSGLTICFRGLINGCGR